MFPLEGLWYHPVPEHAHPGGDLPAYIDGLKTLLATTRHDWRWTSMM